MSSAEIRTENMTRLWTLVFIEETHSHAHAPVYAKWINIATTRNIQVFKKKDKWNELVMWNILNNLCFTNHIMLIVHFTSLLPWIQFAFYEIHTLLWALIVIQLPEVNRQRDTHMSTVHVAPNSQKHTQSAIKHRSSAVQGMKFTCSKMWIIQ